MRELIRKILNEEVPSQVRRRFSEYDRIFKQYRKSFLPNKYRNSDIFWNMLMEVSMETLYHAWFSKTVSDDDWDDSSDFISEYLTKKYKDETEKMWEKKHRKRLNESGKDTKDINESGKYTRAIKELVKIYEDEDFICDIDAEYYGAAGAYIIIVRVDKKEMETYYENETISYATERIRDYLGDLYRNIYREVKTYFPVEVAVHINQTKCSKKINESEDNEEKTIQKNLIVLNKLISMFDYSEVCDMWVRYNSEDGDYEIRSKMSTKNHNTSALEKEFDFLENSIKYLGFTNCYVFRPYYVEQCEDEIKYMNESEEKNQSLLSLLDQYGLYEFMKMTGLSIKQIISKTGELSREVLESYIKEFIENEAQSIPGSDGDRGIVFPIPLSKTKEVESFYLSKGVLTVEINLYDSNDRVVAGSYEKLQNLSYDEIYKIVKELIDWGGDTYYEL